MVVKATTVYSNRGSQHCHEIILGILLNRSRKRRFQMNRLGARLFRWLQGEIATLLISLFFLILIFSAPPLTPKPEFRCFSDPESCKLLNEIAGTNTNPQCPTCKADSVLAPFSSDEDTKTDKRADDTRAILMEEVKKLNAQIQNEIEQTDRWYQYKFAIVGAVLAAFLGFAVFKDSNP